MLWEQNHHQNHPSSRLIRAASFTDRMPLVCHGSAGWSEGRLEKNMWCSCKLSVKSNAHFLCTQSRPSQPNKKYEKSSRNALQRSFWAGNSDNSYAKAVHANRCPDHSHHSEHPHHSLRSHHITQHSHLTTSLTLGPDTNTRIATAHAHRRSCIAGKYKK